MTLSQFASTKMASGRGPGGASATRRPLSGPPARILSDVVGRIAGLPAHRIEKLRAVATAIAAEELLALESEIAAISEPLTDALFTAIGGLADRNLRGALLSAKRDVHNLRPLSASRLAKLDGRVAPSLLEALSRFQKLGALRLERLAAFASTYAQDLQVTRRDFQSAVQDEDFLRGLILSSPTLATALPRYTATDAGKPGSKQRQVERGLMRYFSRMVMKTTPFSTFCASIPGEITGPGKITDEAGRKEAIEAELLGNPHTKTSTVRLNKGIYAHLLTHLLTRPAFRRVLDVELNPTLREEDETWLFLAAIDGRETFQRLASNAVLEYFGGLFKECAHRPYQDLVSQICRDPAIEANAEQAERFADRLLELGFLRFSHRYRRAGSRLGSSFPPASGTSRRPRHNNGS